MINRQYERCFRIKCNNKYSTFEELLEKNNSATMSKQNLRSRATEIFEVINGISPLKVTELFNRNEGIIII